MAKKVGLDGKKAKEFLIQKGERVGLGAAGLVTLLILVLGFLGISTRPPANAGAPTWGKAIDLAADKLKNQIDMSEPTKDDPKDGLKIPVESEMKLAKIWGPLFEPSIGADNKRRNPDIVTCHKEDVQIFFRHVPTLRYQPDDRGRQYTVIDDGSQPAAYALEGRRMVIVYAGFPVNEQLDEFVRTLQAGDREKLLATDPPRILGLDVYRTPWINGKEDPDKAVALYLWKNDKIELAKHLDEFFRQMVIDENNLNPLGDNLGPNMVTPLPLIATVNGSTGRWSRITKINIKDIEVGDEPPETKPKTGTGPDKIKSPFEKKPFEKPGKEAPDAKTTLAVAPPALQERFNGNFNVFDPLAGYLVPPTVEKDKGDVKKKKGPKGKKVPPMNEIPGKEEAKKPAGQPITAEASRLLIRFVDVDVEPGKTYSYYFRVRIANPNYGKSTEVAALDLSKAKELVAGAFTPTNPITIPQENFYYAVDQLELFKATKIPMVSRDKIVDGVDLLPIHNHAEVTAVQIHRWINRFQGEDGSDRRLGDWAIAERLLVRRGDLIGRKKVVVEIPEWFDNKNRFDLGIFSVGKSLKPARGTPVDFLIDENKVPVLVDFQSAEGVSELLVLGGDGKLTVRNSRVDSDPNSPAGKERLEHYGRWHKRVQELRDFRAGRSGGGNTVPTFPGGKKGP